MIFKMTVLAQSDWQRVARSCRPNLDERNRDAISESHEPQTGVLVALFKLVLKHSLNNWSGRQSALSTLKAEGRPLES